MCDELGTALRRMRDKDYDFMIELLCLRVPLGEPLVGWCCLVVFLAFRLFFGFFLGWWIGIWLGCFGFCFCFFFVGGSCFVVFCFYAEKEERRGVYCIFFSSAMI